MPQPLEAKLLEQARPPLPCGAAGAPPAAPRSHRRAAGARPRLPPSAAAAAPNRCQTNCRRHSSWHIVSQAQHALPISTTAQNAMATGHMGGTLAFAACFCCWRRCCCCCSAFPAAAAGREALGEDSNARLGARARSRSSSWASAPLGRHSPDRHMTPSHAAASPTPLRWVSAARESRWGRAHRRLSCCGVAPRTLQHTPPRPRPALRAPSRARIGAGADAGHLRCVPQPGALIMPCS